MGYVIGVGELKIDVAKMDSMRKWPTPTNVTKVKIFVWATQYLQKFIASLLVVVALLHSILFSNKSF